MKNSLSALRNRNTAFRLSSVYDIPDSQGCVTYRVFAPYSDNYSLSCANAESIEIINSIGKTIAAGKNTVSFEAAKVDFLYIKLKLSNISAFLLEVTPEVHKTELPYEIKSSVNASDYPVYSAYGDPLEACEIKYTKRNDKRAMYINSNNPEALSADNINTCLTANDITEKDIFFTFEHNNASQAFTYGYRVTNTGNDDLFITVKNLGMQLDGAGCWLGEDEWIKFYNINFATDLSGLSESQLANYKAYVGFSGEYKSENRLPITYCVPSGKYIYVMGGTTADSYMNINAFGSADKTVSGGCSNGSVLFSTYGSTAYGEFVVYDNVEKLNENIKKSGQTGYVGSEKSGSQYIGYDTCHGVVDCDLVWIFNDKTKSGALPVFYSNPYYLGYKKTGEKYSKINQNDFDAKKHENAEYWITHINPNDTADAIGTDMTKYITVESETKKEIVIDYLHYDGKGNTANIGNWMVDYIDTVTLVNQGDTERKFTYSLDHNGVILAFIRDENGLISNSYTPSYCTEIASSSYGDAVAKRFSYTVTVPAHRAIKFSVDYNLLANSCGHIKHTASIE